MDYKKNKKICLLFTIITFFGLFFCIKSISKRIKSKRLINKTRLNANIANSVNTDLSISQMANNKAQNIALRPEFDKINNPYKNNEHWINVFVHGIVSLAPVLSLKTINHIKQDDIENTVYKDYVKNVRSDRFFCKNEPKQQEGLIAIDKNKVDSHSSCYAISQIFDMQFNNTINYYYTFGWSGLMSNAQRYIDAKKFYIELSAEIKKFNDKGIFPKIRLIGFSHGGTQCLYLSEVIKQEKLPLTFYVDELIMLGTPALDHTKVMINEPVFKKIYNLYSGSDRVQVLDFTQKHKHFSRRKIQSSPEFKISDKLLQVKLEILRPIKKRGGGLADPSLWQKSPPRHSMGIRKGSPGHCEWWFLEYTNTFYRKSFALNPLPILAIVPTILKSLNGIDLKPYKTDLYGNKVTVIIRPFEYYMLIDAADKTTMLEFLSKEQFNKFKDLVLQLNIKKTTKQEYNINVNKHIWEARVKVGDLEKEKIAISKRKTKKSK